MLTDVKTKPWTFYVYTDDVFFSILWNQDQFSSKIKILILSSQLQFYAWFVRKYQTKMLKTSIFEDEMMKYAQHYVYIIKSMRKGIFAGYRKPKFLMDTFQTG